MRYHPLTRNNEFARAYTRGKSFVHPHVVLFMDDGCVMEQNEPHALFASPQNPRLKSFLSKVL